MKDIELIIHTMADNPSNPEPEGGAAVVGVVDIALIAGLIVVIVAIIVRCRKRNDDDNNRLKELKINS